MARDLPSTPTTEDIPTSLGVFDVQGGFLEIIAEPEDGLSFGRPLWSPSKESLAFARYEADTSTYFIQVYDFASEDSRILEVTQPQSLDGDGLLPGLFLFGWSEDGEWLAYDYTYDALWPEPRPVYLMNVLTGETVTLKVPNPENYTSFVWSASNAAFAIANGRAIFVGDVHSPNQLTVHERDGYFGLIAWHPSQDRILVGGSDNLGAASWNQLWLLDPETSEWTQIGSYPGLIDFSFSPGGESIAILLQKPDLSNLAIVDVDSFETVQEFELPSDLFFDLDWLNDSTVALTSRENIYVVPTATPTESYWLFEADSSLYDSFSQITFTDW